MPRSQPEPNTYAPKRWLISAASPVALALIGLIGVLILFQSRYLFFYPVPDTGMWFGDETWTMLTLRAMAAHGIARIPEALGSSLAISNGFVNGSVWLSALIYGIPANVMAWALSPVSTGRCVTLGVSILLLVVMYRIARESHLSREHSLFALVLLVASPVFAFASHSARLDLITSLAVLFFVLFVTRGVRAIADGRILPLWWYFVLGLFASLSLAVYVHVPTLIVLVVPWTLWKVRASLKHICATATGGLVGALVLWLIYQLTTHDVTLFGAGYNQYFNVLHSLPILHPTSFAVQKINTWDRFIQLCEVAWPIVTVAILGASYLLIRKRRTATIGAQKNILVITGLIALCWMAFEGPAVFYNIHVVPLYALVTSIVAARVLTDANGRTSAYAILCVSVLFGAISIIAFYPRAEVGKRLALANNAAITRIIGPIVAATDVPPLILTDQPGYDALAERHDVRLMTNHLLLFGMSPDPLPDILHKNHVDYLMLYSTHRWASPFRQIADSLYQLIASETGTLTDQAREYSDARFTERDTIRLYRARP